MAFFSLLYGIWLLGSCSQSQETHLGNSSSGTLHGRGRIPIGCLMDQRIKQMEMSEGIQEDGMTEK